MKSFPSEQRYAAAIHRASSPPNNNARFSSLSAAKRLSHEEPPSSSPTKPSLPESPSKPQPRSRSLIASYSSMIHDDLPFFRFFNDSSIRKVSEMEVEAFKQSLDKFIHDANVDSERFLQPRPRFIHAVAVLADPKKSGEIMKATCIKQLDPYHIVIEDEGGIRRPIEIEKVEGTDELIQAPIKQSKQTVKFETNEELQRRKDSEIEAALKILQESRDLLEDTAMSIRFPSEIRARRMSAYGGGNSVKQ